ncbi:RcnB family protein [Novosphingobium album (ex Hu et al. 2023)]|uniref:RcnB family protein n=1 Tax=Novosphingobium album (ex Hu et al. 2023) TaxID=2930093 RepID=A0ABT0AYL7_9SPHN|nr:RcnB family protein [Novosphingobium album (ex Hu et al. 2023)]MCJ2177895.1 RcnB family protein [Novosphingobium album (ex Hu et al. 2023)]
MTDHKTRKTSRLFTAAAWGAMALSVASLGMADIASAAEQRTYGRDNRDGNNSPRPDRRAGQDRRSTPQPTRTAAPQRAQPAQAPQRSTYQNRNSPPNMTEARQGAFERSRQQQNEREQRRDVVREQRDYRADQRDYRTNQRNDRAKPQTNRREDRRDQRSDWRNGQRDDNRDRRYDRRDDRRDYRDARRWDRNDWRHDNRYDWRSYRARNRTVYRIGRYNAPYYGYRYRRLGIGFSLGTLFYGSRYWITDPWYYRLPEVYGPYRWVRYYDDVLLVNIYTGEVVDVIYDFFW